MPDATSTIDAGVRRVVAARRRRRPQPRHGVAAAVVRRRRPDHPRHRHEPVDGVHGDVEGRDLGLRSAHGRQPGDPDRRHGDRPLDPVPRRDPQPRRRGPDGRRRARGGRSSRSTCRGPAPLVIVVAMARRRGRRARCGRCCRRSVRRTCKLPILDHEPAAQHAGACAHELPRAVLLQRTRRRRPRRRW